jgi:hypothetical protein
MLVLCPEHVATIWEDGWSKEQIRDRIQKITQRSVRSLLRNEEIGAGLDPNQFANASEEELNKMIPKFRSNENIHIMVAGSEAGKFSAVLEGWASGPTGSIPTSRKIND